MAYTAPKPAASSAAFADLKKDGISGVLRAVIAAQAATADPTVAPTLAASGTGNTLTAATYFVVITENGPFGETKISPESSGQTVTSGQKLTVTFPSLKSGNQSRNVYGAKVTGGPYTRYASGITASSLDITADPPTNSYAEAPPTVNSTALTYTDAAGNTRNRRLVNANSFLVGRFEAAYRDAVQNLRNFLRGDPQAFSGVMTHLGEIHAAVKILDETLTEVGTLVDANAGTIGQSSNAIGVGTRKRTWP